MKLKVTDEQIIAAWPTNSSIPQIASKFGMSPRQVCSRVSALRAKGAPLPSPNKKSPFYNKVMDAPTPHVSIVRYDARIELKLPNGIILVGSDSHYWPGVVTTAHNAFLEFIREFKPKVIIKNGDEADFPTISRHAQIAWESRPKVSEEIDNIKAMLGEVEKVSNGARLLWPLGNHDGRFETRLATVAPEYAEVHGVHLKDNFPKWEPCWATLINSDVVVKHRFKSGMHAPHNNTLWSGRTMLTGHLHSLKVMPISDYNGTRWGVDCGTMADPYGPQFFNYTELNPLNWRSGFILLTFVKGELLWPEHVFVRGPGVVDFRGALHNV